MIDVALRLGLKGGTDVERALKAVGQEGKTSMREIRDAARGLPPSMVAVSRSVAGVKDSIAGLASRAPGQLGAVAGSFGFLGTAVAAAGVAVGAAAVAMFRLGMAAADVGDELGGAALRIGVSAEALQKLRFAAGEVDVEVSELDAGLKGLNVSLGAFRSGVGDARVKKVFEALGLTPESLRDVKTAADFLPILADRIASVQSQAERVKLAQALGVEALLPLLEQGADRVRDFTDAAEKAGLVISDEMVKELGDLHREMEKVDGRLKTATTTLGAKFAPAIAEAKSELADLLLVASGADVELGGVAGLLDRLGESAFGADKRLNNYLLTLTTFIAAVQGSNFLPALGVFRAPPSSPGARPLNPGFDLQGDYSGNPRQAGQLLPGWQADVARLRAEAEAEAEAKGKGGARASGRAGPDTAAREAADARRKAALLEEIELENKLDRARAAGVEGMVKALETQLALKALIARYERAGLDDVQARLEAEKQIASLKWIRDNVREIDTETPNGFTSSEDRMKALGSPDFGPDWAALREDFRITFKDGFRAALDGDFGTFLAARVEEAFIKGLDDSLDVMADALFNLVRAAFSKVSAGPGGGGDWWGAVVVDFIASLPGGDPGGGSGGGHGGGHGGGGRATGGPVWRGDSRMVGEQGPERLSFGADGYIDDAATTARQLIDSRPVAPASSDRASAGGPVTVNITNPAGTPLRAQVQESRESGGGQRLDIEMFNMIDRRVDERVSGMTRGGRDDQVLGREFGLRRNLRGG